jgi:putative ABC transport system ATP-binding protein
MKGPELAAPRPLLALENLAKSWVSGGSLIHAVDDVSLAVHEGEFVSIYGPSGSGKSTLLMIAAGLVSPDDGAVWVDGRDIVDLTDAEASDHLRRTVGFVHQHFDLMAGVSAIDNAALKLLAERISRRRAQRTALPWLRSVGLEGRKRHTPDQLSGGEAQRVAIARALANEPKLLLADEPTGNLDTQSGDDVLSLFDRLRVERGLAVVLVTHDPEAAERSDRVYTLRDGKLTAGLQLATRRRPPQQRAAAQR